MVRKAFLLAVLLACCVLLLHAQQPRFKYVTAPRTPANDGRMMYMSYCASCHGAQGHGDGPVAQVFKDPIPDLTTLASRNGGKFPYVAVIESIQGDPRMPAHGTLDMPVWGPVLRQLSDRSEAEFQLRLHNITDHVESMQHPQQAQK